MDNDNDSKLLSVDDREKLAMDELDKRRRAMMEMSLNKSVSYLENENLKKFNKKLRRQGFLKARRSIKLGTVDEVDEDIQSYFDLCDEYAQLPSVKSLSLYLGISVATYNSYMRETDSEYGELFRAAIDYIHSVIEGGAMNNKVNPATYMFTAANFYGMRDSRKVEIGVAEEQRNGAVSSRESLNALRQELEREKKGTTSDGAKSIEFEDKNE